MEKKEVAVLGSNGMLATDIRQALAARGYAVLPFCRPDWDITRTDDVRVAAASAPVIVNCAAYTQVDRSESDTDLAHYVNAVATGELGRWAADHGAYVVHFGTDHVFDGDQTRPYAEDDTPCPVNAYGQTKLEGEERLVASGCDYLILRLEWTFGCGGENFLSKVLRAAAEHDEIRVVDDQTGAPTPTVDVSNVVCDLLERRTTGLYHFAANAYATRFEIAEFVASTRGLNTRVLPCGSAEFPSVARRPLNSMFDCSKIDGLLPCGRRHWRDGVREYLRNG